MDENYKESNIAQLRGNPMLTVGDVELAVGLIKKLGESGNEMLSHLKGHRGRFFYSATTDEVSTALRKVFGENYLKSRTNQRLVNQISRKYGSPTLFVDIGVTGTYTRGRHRYYNGIRVY